MYLRVSREKAGSRSVSNMTYGNGLVESDTYSLDYEINRLLEQSGAASVQDNVCTRTDNLNLTDISDGVTPANNRSASNTDLVSASFVDRLLA